VAWRGGGVFCVASLPLGELKTDAMGFMSLMKFIMALSGSRMGERPAFPSLSPLGAFGSLEVRALRTGATRLDFLAPAPVAAFVARVARSLATRLRTRAAGVARVVAAFIFGGYLLTSCWHALLRALGWGEKRLEECFVQEVVSERREQNT
jgi:hypothetical protein